MIATILSNSANFSGIDYNEKKVSEGVATIIEAKNIEGLASLRGRTPQELKDFFIDYSSRNPNVKKAQFHISFSVKGNEMTPQQVLDFANQWMREMGYGDEGQPMIAYAHYDTGNTHIHIITSRVNPEGKKINDSMEKKRARAVLERLMGLKPKENLDKTIKDVFSNYRFSSTGQFLAIFESMGYEAYQDKQSGAVCLKKNGDLQAEIPVEQINAHLRTDRKKDEVDKKQVWAAKMKIEKLANVSSNMSEFIQSAREKFGLAIVLLGKKDAPYGYIVVDHKNKAVFNGSQVCKLADLTAKFKSPEERLSQARLFIEDSLRENPELLLRELNYQLVKATGTKIVNGQIEAGTLKETIAPAIIDQLKNNDRLSWVRSFRPSTSDEREVVCKLCGWDEPEKIDIGTRIEIDSDRLRIVKECCEAYLNNADTKAFKDAKMALVWNKGIAYVVDYKAKAVYNISEMGLLTSQSHLEMTERILRETLNDNPDIDTRALNDILIDKTGGYVKQNVLYINGHIVPLRPEEMEELNQNNRASWVTSFRPKNETERDLLCRMLKVYNRSKVKIDTSEIGVSEEALNRLATAYNEVGPTPLKTRLNNAGFRVEWADGRAFCVDAKMGIIVDLSREGFNTAALLHSAANNNKPKTDLGLGRDFKKFAKSTERGNGKVEKRDWEISSTDEDSLDNKDRSRGMGY